MTPKGDNKKAVVVRMLDESGAAVESAPHSKQIIWLGLTETAEEFDVLRRAEK